jgi:hypothetical protein
VSTLMVIKLYEFAFYAYYYFDVNFSFLSRYSAVQSLPLYSNSLEHSALSTHVFRFEMCSDTEINDILITVNSPLSSTYGGCSVPVKLICQLHEKNSSRNSIQR